MTTIGKITVRYFLNQKVKPSRNPILGDSDLFPLYIQVTYNRKNTQFRSLYKGCWVNLEDAFKQDGEKLDYEESLIRKMIEGEIKTKKEHFQLKGLKDRYVHYSIEISFSVDKYIRNTIFNSADKTGSKFSTILDPFTRPYVTAELYYEASEKLIENFNAYLPKDFKKELIIGEEFISWCKKKKESPRLIEWLYHTLSDEYRIFLQEKGDSENQINSKVNFINKALKMSENLVVM